MLKVAVSFFVLMGLLTSCTAAPWVGEGEGTSPPSESAGKITSATSPGSQQPERTFAYEALPLDMRDQTIFRIPSQAELGYNAMDPAVLYERFPDIVTAEVLFIGMGRNYSETKKMNTMTFSPITIQVEQVWKGSYFNEGEQISLFVYGGYLPYREVEKTFHPDDEKAQATSRTMSETDKDATWYFTDMDGRSFPDVGKKYLFHVHEDEYGEHYISGWGLGIQEIDPLTDMLPSRQSVAEYIKKVQ